MRLREDAVAQLRRQVVVDDEFRAHDAVRLGVAAALVFAGPVVLAHVVAEASMIDGSTMPPRRERPLLGEHEALVRAPAG